MAVIVVSWRSVEIASCSMCSIEFVMPSESDLMFAHEAGHHDGDAFCVVHAERSPYVLGVRGTWLP